MSCNPWAELRDDPKVTLEWDYLPDDTLGLYVDKGDGTATIILDAGLGRTERRATLCHELRHHARGICGSERIDERGIDDEVALLLVPQSELGALYDVAYGNDLPVEVWHVAEKFDVPDYVAERAMLLFLRGKDVVRGAS